MQDLFFAKYWAQLAVNKPIGLVQRVLFSFSAKIKEKNVLWNEFFDKVVAPIVKDLFRMVLKTFGPKAPGDVERLALSASQTQVVADIEETLTLFSQRKRVGQCMRAAMPKAGNTRTSILVVSKRLHISFQGPHTKGFSAVLSKPTSFV